MSQYVQIDGQKSASSNITCDVPQGSILCPLFLIVYINDFNPCTKYLECMHFADDSTLYFKSKSFSDLAVKIITELQKVVKLFQINKLSHNVSKSYATVFSSACQVNLHALAINGISLFHSPTKKFLGILVDNKLNFARYIRR